MIKVLFFAQIREILDCASLEIDGEYNTVDDLRASLLEKGDKWALALDSDKLLVAINQEITTLSAPLTGGDEVAFFPPVTGG